MNSTPADIVLVRLEPLDCIRKSFELVGSRYWLLLGITLVGMLIGSAAPLGILMGPMMCGIYLCLIRLMRDEPIEFGTLFKGFDFFVQSMIVSLISVGVSLAITIPLGIVCFVLFIVSAASGSPAALLSIVFFYVVMIFAMVIVGMFFMFAFPLIADRNMTAVAALKTSIRTARTHFAGLLGLMLLSGALALAGLCLCCIGVYFVLPIQFGAFAIAYRKIFPEIVPSVPPPAA